MRVARLTKLKKVEKKITSLCVYKNKDKKKTIGIIHIHNILNSNIS